MARLTKASIAIEAVARVDALLAIERHINGLLPEKQREVRHERNLATGRDARPNAVLLLLAPRALVK